MRLTKLGELVFYMLAGVYLINSYIHPTCGFKDRVIENFSTEGQPIEVVRRDISFGRDNYFLRNADLGEVISGCLNGDDGKMYRVNQVNFKVREGLCD